MVEADIGDSLKQALKDDVEPIQRHKQSQRSRQGQQMAGNAVQGHRQKHSQHQHQGQEQIGRRAIWIQDQVNSMLSQQRWSGTGYKQDTGKAEDQSAQSMSIL